MLNKNNFLPILIAIVLLTSLINVASLDSLGTFKQSEDVRITQVCSDATYINLSSISYPNSSTAVSGIEMDSIGSGEFYYNFTNTNSLGRYDVRGISDGCEETFATYFEITPTGVMQTTSQSIGSAIYLVLMLSLTGLFLYGGFKLSESQYLWVLGIFSMFLCFIFIVYDVWLGYEYQKNWTGMAASGIPEILFYIFLTLLVSGFLVSLALLFTRWKELYRYIKKEIKNNKERKEMEELDDWEGWGR